MDSLAARISPVLHLARVTSAFAAVGNLWFVILWTRALPPERAIAPKALLDAPLPLLLVGGALAGLGLYTFATILNDTLDFRRDRSLHPDRPLPSGRISMDAAARLIAFSLIVSVLGCSLIGGFAVRACLAVSVGVLLYNALAKQVPSLGVVLLGLIYAAHMLIPNPWMGALWPVWVAMTHMLIVGAVAHHVGNRRPRLSISSLISAGVGWAFWTAVLAWLMVERTGSWWPAWIGARAPTLVGSLGVGFAAFVWLQLRHKGSGQRAAGRIHRYGSLWLVLYAAAWLFGQGLNDEGWIITALGGAGLLGMTVLRELYHLIEQPVGYRR